jgi:hypothetical protein
VVQVLAFAGVGELGRTFASEQHDRSVTSEVVGPPVVGPACSPPVGVLEPVVYSAFRLGIGLDGSAAVGM